MTVGIVSRFGQTMIVVVLVASLAHAQLDLRSSVERWVTAHQQAVIADSPELLAIPMDLPQIESIVRVTARISAAAFATALIVFASSGLHRRHIRRAVHFLIAFVLAHTIHFLAVAWLAMATQGENIQARGGWAVALPAAALFYASAFGVLRAWNAFASGRAVSNGERLAAYGGVAVIALVFLNSYVARVATLPVYWFPTIGMIVIVAGYFVRARRRRL
jgi:hypothetical protein